MEEVSGNVSEKYSVRVRNRKKDGGAQARSSYTVKRIQLQKQS